MSLVYTVALIAWLAVYQSRWQEWGATGDKLNVIRYSG